MQAPKQHEEKGVGKKTPAMRILDTVFLFKSSLFEYDVSDMR
jgi:hypothetical protein